MSGNDFEVPPLSWDAIAGTTSKIREILKVENTPFFPIMPVLEKILDQQLEDFTFMIGDEAEMGNAEGYTDPTGKFIMLREDVVRAAWNGEGRARFTAAHELGHLILHRNVPLARFHCDNVPKAYRRSEPQANHFAAELLMPSHLFRKTELGEACKIFGVSASAAQNRHDYLVKKGLMKII
jgi:hypothetical protein